MPDDAYLFDDSEIEVVLRIGRFEKYRLPVVRNILKLNCPTLPLFSFTYKYLSLSGFDINIVERSY